MTPRRLALLLALVLPAAARPAAAQDPGGPRQVRLVAPAAGITELLPARLVQVRGDSMVVELAGMQKTVAVADVTRLQRVAGVENRLVYAAVGALGGGLAGYGGGMLRREWSISHDDQRVPFTTLGAVLGALLAARFMEPGWQEVPGYAAVVPTERGDALALGVELRF